MNIIKEIKMEIIKSVIWLGIGLLALFIGYVLNFDRNTMGSIALGFIPAGIGMTLISIYLKKNPKLMKNIELEKEERNVFINTKAGYTAFWISYGYIFIVTMFGSLINFTLSQFLIITLILMPIIHITFIFVYHKKY